LGGIARPFSFFSYAEVPSFAEAVSSDQIGVSQKVRIVPARLDFRAQVAYQDEIRVPTMVYSAHREVQG